MSKVAANTTSIVTMKSMKSMSKGKDKASHLLKVKANETHLLANAGT